MARYFAHVGIEPKGDLSQTALILGEAFGGLEFVEDTQRRFDEFPAFIGQENEAIYVLLGVPDPSEDLRDEPTTDFELQVIPGQHATGDSIDVSDQLIARIEADGRLRCWPLT